MQLRTVESTKIRARPRRRARCAPVWRLDQQPNAFPGHFVCVAALASAPPCPFAQGSCTSPSLSVPQPKTGELGRLGPTRACWTKCSEEGARVGRAVHRKGCVCVYNCNTYYGSINVFREDRLYDCVLGSATTCGTAEVWTVLSCRRKCVLLFNWAFNVAGVQNPVEKKNDIGVGPSQVSRDSRARSENRTISCGFDRRPGRHFRAHVLLYPPPPREQLCYRPFSKKEQPTALY